MKRMRIAVLAVASLLAACAKSGDSPTEVPDGEDDAAMNDSLVGDGPRLGDTGDTIDAADAADGSDGKTDVARDAPIDAGSTLPRCGGAPGLRGAFLAVTNDPPAPFWGRAVDAMAALGMTDVVIQTVAYPPVGGVPNAVDARNIKAVLDAAKAHGMRVLIGLAQSDGNGDPAKAADATFIGKVIDQSKLSAKDIVTTYGADAAFDGFYLSMEPWTPQTPTELGHLPEYVQQVSVYARSVAPHAVRIAMSPFVSGAALKKDPAPTEAAYRSMLATASIDIVMLQDGVGVLRLDGAAIADVVPLFRAMKAACTARSVALWANVESFALDTAGTAKPTTFDRLLLQLRAAGDTTVDVVTYEFTGDMFGEGKGGVAAQTLVDRYRAGCTFTR